MGGRGGALSGSALLLLPACGWGLRAVQPSAAPQLHCMPAHITCPAAGRAVIERHLRDGTLLQQYTAVLEILLRLRQVRVQLTRG